MSKEFSSLRSRLIKLGIAGAIAFSPADSELNANSELEHLNPEQRQATIHELDQIDTNYDGLLDLTGPKGTVKSGDIIHRKEDGITSVEEGLYIVPNNNFFIDEDSDGDLDDEAYKAKVVVVIEDSLTYLFSENSSEVIGVFPNGVGSNGSNSVPSIRRINVKLGEKWGADYSERAGYEDNMFGVITIGTRYVVDKDPKNDIDTFQEIHGTPDNLKFLLGEEISGGCVRHSNQAIRIISQNTSLGDFILTVSTPEDDQIDNAVNLYNRTRIAAKLPPIDETLDYSDEVMFTKPNNLPENTPDFKQINKPTWIDVDLVAGQNRLPLAEHPFTRGEYTVIPCGTETFFLSQIANNKNVLILSEKGYKLNLAENILGANGEMINISDFYTTAFVENEDIQERRHYFSGGDIKVAYFQYLVWDYAYQYAEYVAKRDSKTVFANQALLNSQVANLSPKQLHEVQLVTGLIPEGKVADRFSARENRTLEHSLMNIFYGKPGQVYQLDYRKSSLGKAQELRDLNISYPSRDHELITNGKDPVEIVNLLEDAIDSNQDVVFRIAAYRQFTKKIDKDIHLSANHYYTLLPQYSNIKEGYIGVHDSMHPYKILIIPNDDISYLFSTITISPLLQ